MKPCNSGLAHKQAHFARNYTAGHGFRRKELHGGYPCSQDVLFSKAAPEKFTSGALRSFYRSSGLSNGVGFNYDRPSVRIGHGQYHPAAQAELHFAWLKVRHHYDHLAH